MPQDPAREVAVLPSRVVIDAAHRLTRDIRAISRSWAAIQQDIAELAGIS
jgi:hypothetical protein